MWPRVSTDPMMAPPWIIGPSGPSAMPDDTTMTVPQIFASSVRNLSIFRMCTPAKNAPSRFLSDFPMFVPSLSW